MKPPKVQMNKVDVAPPSLSPLPQTAIGMMRAQGGGWVYYTLTIEGNQVTDVKVSQPDPRAIIQEAFKIAVVKEFFNK